jgi:hypothetical protein
MRHLLVFGVGCLVLGALFALTGCGGDKGKTEAPKDTIELPKPPVPQGGVRPSLPKQQTD